ncbi:MAG: M16 family metallopeptidase, partial [Tepidisphaeraceae bacterium]
GWLSNNVRVNYRFMDQRKNDVTVQISLIGGELLETADNRGVTSAARLAWSRPATKELSSSDIRELMTGKKISVGGGGGMGGGRGGGRRGGGGGGGGSGDSISLTVSGSPTELETGLQLAYLLLTEPRIEASAFTQFQTTTRQMLREAFKTPQGAAMRLVSAAPYPESEIRTRPMTPEQIDKLSLASAQAWLGKLIQDSPIEVVIVGDIDKDKALALVSKYLGSLPERPRVGPELYASLRKIQRPSGPRIFEKSVDSNTDQAIVFSGFYGADESNLPDVRALNMAARILSTRMNRQVREEAQLVYSIGAGSRAATTYPGFGVFSAQAPTDPHKVEALVAKLASMYQTFAADGPTADELTIAKKQMATTFEEQIKEPSYWMQRLTQLTYRGTSLDDLASGPAAYQSLTTDQVKDTFAKYYSKDNAIIVVVTPKPTSGALGSGGQKPSDKTAHSGD